MYASGILLVGHIERAIGTRRERESAAFVSDMQSLNAWVKLVSGACARVRQNGRGKMGVSC